MTVFDAFTSTPYDFLKLGRGGILGDTVEVVASSTGVFKERDGVSPFNANLSVEASTATLHIRPTESFLADLNYNLVGQGIRHQNQDYLIVGQSTGRGGTNFDIIEHYKLTLRRESISESNES